MSKRTKRAKRTDPGGGVPGERDIRTLEMMLDYAIVEGAELRLPLFVLLLRTARLELMASIGAHGGPSDGRVETKFTDRLGPDNAHSLAAPGPQDFAGILQDR